MKTLLRLFALDCFVTTVLDSRLLQIVFLKERKTMSVLQKVSRHAERLIKGRYVHALLKVDHDDILDHDSMQMCCCSCHYSCYMNYVAKQAVCPRRCDPCPNVPGYIGGTREK